MKGKASVRKKSSARLGRSRSRLWKRVWVWVAGLAGAGLLVVVTLFLLVSAFPAFGAEGADWLRGLLGDKAVAGLEMAFNQAQDDLQHWKYRLGWATPGVEWAPVVSPTIGTPPSIGETYSPTSTTPPPPASTISATATPASTATPQPSGWPPANLQPLGKAKDEGVWSPYIQDGRGETVAYRTFVQPDPERPYTLVAIVAIDLEHTRLHFVLGEYEPALPDTPPRPGSLPKTDRVAGVLLAAFNGGFKARHGQFGAMADGLMALPPREGLGTLAIYQDGSVRLGEWGTDLSMSPGIVAFRQNGPLVLQHGHINVRIYNNSPQDWGYTVNDVSPTVRSGVGLSADGRRLYYFCGPSLSMDALARSMQAAGAANAIQLDINNYWVLFVRFQASGVKLLPEPLLPRLMVANVDRYLLQSSRDFFYLTALP